MADKAPEERLPAAKLVAALELVGIDQKTWDRAETKEAKSALFNTKKDDKLAELKNTLDAASTNETKKPIQDNIDLLNLASKDLSTPDEEKDTKNNEEPPPIESKKKKSDSGAKSWMDIMMELMEGPELDDIKDAGEKMEAICNRLRSLMPETTPKEIEGAQRELYFAAMKDFENNPDTTAGKEDSKKWIESNGPMGNKIKDAVLQNEWRKAALVKELHSNNNKQNPSDVNMTPAPSTQQNTTPQNKNAAVLVSAGFPINSNNEKTEDVTTSQIPTAKTPT
jgi:hypothetical protein